MAKNKNNQAIWNTRIKKKASTLFEKVGSSIDIDKRLYKEDIFEFNKKYEDIHMNIEKKLFQIIGDEAGYIHTARSRNDQVITDFKMWIRSATKKINTNLEKIVRS